MKMRTLIVDDEPLAREWVRNGLQDEPDIEIVGECGDGFEAVKTITENLRRTKLSKLGRVRRLEARRAVRERPGPFELVILDPPYRLEQPELEALLSEIAGQGVVAPGGRVVLSRSTRTYMPVIPVNWLLERRLSYGDTLVFIYRIP